MKETIKDHVEQMSLKEIALLVKQDWKNVCFSALPYLSAMEELSSLNDVFSIDTSESVVMYFLSNATTWRGPVARLVKRELNCRLKKHRG